MTLHHTLADQLRHHLATSGISRLPSQRELATRFGVCRTTVAKAIALLRREGIVVTRRRGGMLAADSSLCGERSVFAPRRSSAQRLCEHIHAAIAEGRYRAGEPLPKIQFFVLEHHLSAHTVGRALAMLERRGIVYRQGKQRIVGSPRPPAKRVGSPGRPVVAVCMPTESSWRFLCRLPNRGRFAVRFAQECATHGIRTFPLLTDPNPPDHLAGILPAGRRQARRFLDAHREQCIGILLVVNRLGETATGEWIRFLGKYGVAVLVFALESTPSDDTWKPDGRNVLLCRTSEREMADKAIEECRNAGIDHIGAIKITRGFTATAAGLLEAFGDRCRRSKPPFGLTVECEPFPFWENRPDGQTPMEVITRLRKTGIPLVRRILTRALEHDPTLLANPELHKKNPDMYRHRVLSPSDMRLVWSTHLLAPLLRRAPVSCLLALDEEQAAAFFYWLTAMNITIPAELSLLSIGNSENLSPLPVSSIDPGYDHLGYLAFHAILDDIPVRVRRGNHLCGAVSLVDRGSLGSSTGLRDTGRLRGEIR